MSWTEADIPDLTGKTAVVTGANGGLGLETARALAAKGAHVVMAARDQDKAAGAADDIRAGVPEASLELVELDLSSQSSVREAAARILERHGRIDILVNNAGVMGIPERRTEDGFEMQLATNHLGHYALTALLMPALLRADAARVVSVTSTAHHMGRAVDPGNPHLEGRYSPWRAYGQSKLANFHFAIGLQRLFEEQARLGVEPARPPRPVEHRPAGCQRARDRGRAQPAVLPRPRGPHRHVARAWRAAPAAGGDRPRRRGRRVLRAALCQQRTAGAQTDRPPDRHRPCDRPAVGGVRARDRPEARGRHAGSRPLVTGATVDRAAAVRRALRSLVARHGFHGASMSAVAAEAGVATGTAYTHYASKDELVLAAYLETKAELADAATAGLDPAARPAERFRHMWLAAHRHLAADRDRALFLLQVDCSPYKTDAHAAAMARGDPLRDQAAAPDIAERLLPLPLEVIYELGLGPAVRLAAAGTELGERELRATADACWRAISRPAQTRVAAHSAAAP